MALGRRGHRPGDGFPVSGAVAHGPAGAGFNRFLGVDWSGAKVGGNVFLAEVVRTAGGAPLEVLRVERSSRAKVEAELRLVPDRRTLAGLDFSFSFPEAFVLGGRADWTWPELRRWTADLVASSGGDVRAALHAAPERSQFRLVPGDRAPLLRRRTEEACIPLPASVFDLVVYQRQVTLGTIHGMAVLDHLADVEHLAVWPYDGERVTGAATVVAEAYPSMWLDPDLRKGSDADRREQVLRWQGRPDLTGLDADTVVLLHRSGDAADALAVALALPELTLDAPADDVAAREGWILGVPPTSH